MEDCDKSHLIYNELSGYSLSKMKFSNEKKQCRS